MNAVEVSAHVPRYISGNITKIASHSREGIVACLTSTDKSSLYFYSYYVAGDRLVQNAWWKATFNDSEIHHIEFIDNDLILFVKHTSGFFLEKMVFKSGRVDSGLSYLNHLDRRFSATGGTYASASDTTPIQAPAGYKFESDDPIQVISQDGVIPTISSVDAVNFKVHVNGNFAGKTMYVGEKYTMKYAFSEQLMREGNPPRPIAEGRISLRYGTLLYEDTGFFKVSVTPVNRSTYEYKLGAVTGVSSIGTSTVRDGRLKYAVHTKASDATIEVTNDTPLPSRLTGAEFEFSYNARSRRMA